MPAARRKSTPHTHRRQEILDAARQSFLARGYSATTIDSIAAKVEISPALIYKHFNGKPALFASIVEEGLDRLHATLSDATASAPPGPEAVRALAHAYLRFYREQRDYFNVLNFYDHVQGQTPFPPPHRECIQEKVVGCLQVVADALKAGQANGTFRMLDAWETANVFWGAFNGILLLEAHGKTRLAETDLEPLLEVMLQMFHRAIEIE